MKTRKSSRFAGFHFAKKAYTACGQSAFFCFFNNRMKGSKMYTDTNTINGVSRILQPTKVSPCESITAIAAQHKAHRGRPTVVPLVIHNDGLLIVQSAHHGHWGLPQGGIKSPIDGTCLQAALREASEELGLEEKYLVPFKRQMIGEYPNPIPKDRNLAFDYKQMLLIALPVSCHNWVKLNEENQAFSWVHSFDELIMMIGDVAEDRWVKFQATCEAIGEVCKTGLLPWQVEMQQELVFA